MKVRLLNLAFFIAVSAVLWNVFIEPGVAQEKFSQWPAGVKSKRDLTGDRSYTYDFSEIDVARLQWWLDAIRLRLPVRLEGKLSGWFWAQRSENGWFDFRNYKVEASLQSPNLQIDQWLVSNANLRFGYANGNWYVGKLYGLVKSPAVRRVVGTVDLKTKILTSSTSDVKFWVDFESVDLHELLQSLGIENPIGRSDGRVHLSGTLPLNHAFDLKKWDAVAEVKVAAVELPWMMSPSTASAMFTLSKGNWRLNQGLIRVADHALAISGNGRLDKDFPFEFSAEGNGIDASKLLFQLKAKTLSQMVSGQIQLRAKVQGSQEVGIELANASIDSNEVKVDATIVKSFSAKTTYSPGQVKLAIEKAGIAGGNFHGTVQWKSVEQIVGSIPAMIQLELQNVELGEIHLAVLPFRLGGKASGNISIEKIDKDRSSVLISSGRVRINGMTAINSNLGNLDLQWNKDKVSNDLIAALSLEKGLGSLESKIVATFNDQDGANAGESLFSHYTAEGKFDDYQIEIRPDRDRSFSVPLKAIGGFSVAGTSARLIKKGSVDLSRSTLFFSNRELNFEHAIASFDEKEIRVDRFRLFDTIGELSGMATIQRGNAGEHLVKLNASGVELKTYFAAVVPKSLGALNGLGGFEIGLNKPAADSDLWSGWNGKFEGALKELSFAEKKIGQLSTRGTIKGQWVVASAEGKLLAGKTGASAKFPLSLLSTDNKADPEREGEFQVDVTGFEARRLAALFLSEQRARSFVGAATVQFDARFSQSNGIAISAKLNAPLVRRERNVVARDFVANLKYSGGTIVIERVSGGFANGRINAKGQFGLAKESLAVESGRLDIAAQRLDVRSAVSMFAPDYAESYAGKVGFRGALSYRRGFNITGHVAIDNGNAYGIPLQRLNGLVRVSFDSKGKFEHVISSGLQGKGYGGGIEARLKISGGSQIGLDISGSVVRGRLEQLSKSMGFAKVVGGGSFDGRFEIRSKKIASLKSLNGGVWIKFENGDTQTVPLVSTIDRFVPLIPFASTEIQDGFLNAKLSLGQLRISELKLSSKSFMLAANGDVALDGSRLDLETIVFTGGNIQQRIVQSAIQKLVAASVPQLAAIMELNDLLRNRTVFLHIGGSPARPVVQPKVGETVIRAFLQNLSGGLFTQNGQLTNGSRAK